MSIGTIALAGNPNCGKTTLFNALTGANQRVGNWSGVTVERKSGEYVFAGESVTVVDLPGTYSLDLPHGDTSVDEQIARDFILSGESDLVINVIDAAHLERHLYLTSQLLEMRVPMLVVLNMMDKATQAGLQLDVDGLADRLGCPVVAVTASREQGVEDLKQRIAASDAESALPTTALTYGEAIDTALAELYPQVAPFASDNKLDPHWLTLKLLEDETVAVQCVDPDIASQAKAMHERLEADLGDDLDIMIADARYGFVHGLVHQCQTQQGQVARDVTELIDRFVLNRLIGIPIFLLVMYLMFMFTINIGGAFIDFFDQATAAIMVDGVKTGLDGMGAPNWLQVLLGDGIGGGIQTVATFIPIVSFLFLFLSVLEDSGYMTRAAFVMDRLMRAIGLPGKSFVPLIVGFGCNVPAIMSARTLDNPRDRLLTVAMTPFMSCGARLPVYALFAAAFFPTGGQNMVFALYLIGIAAAVLTGLALKHTLLQGPSAPFVMEMPTYHLPTLKGVGIRTWERTRSFLVKAGGVIVPMVVVLAVLNSTGTDGSFGNEDSDKSVLSEIGRGLTPVFAPMGIEEDNWPATVGIFTGFLAKEAVVGTLDSLYSELAADELGDTAKEDFDLGAALMAAVASIPTNLRDAIGMADDPLGLNLGDLSDAQQAAQDQQVAMGTFGAMVARFDGAIGAFAYLLFILLYAPCTAAIAAVYRETGTRWAIFVALWTTGLAYASGTTFYQLGTLHEHPTSSVVWVLVIATLFLSAVLWMRRWGQANPGWESHAHAPDQETHHKEASL